MAQNRKKKKNNKNGNRDVLGMVLVVVSAFFLLCIIVKPILGVFSAAIFNVILGVIGFSAYPLFVGTLLLGVMFLLGKSLSANRKTVVCLSLLIVFLMMILQLATTSMFLDEKFSVYIDKTYTCHYSAGGVLFGLIAYGLSALITDIACYIVFSLAVIIDILVWTSAFSRIAEHRRNRRNIPLPEPPAPSKPVEAQRVVPASAPTPSLYVSPLVAGPTFETEQGTASDLPLSSSHTLTDYSQNAVLDKPAEPSRAESSKAALFKLYGDSEEMSRQSKEAFTRRNVTPPPAPEFKPFDAQTSSAAPATEPEPMDPAQRVKADAANMPNRMDFDGKPNNFDDLYFPPEKNIQFNDEGIENVDELTAALKERSRERNLRSALGMSQPKRSAPNFGYDERTAPLDPVEEIIDASAPLVPPTPPAPEPAPEPEPEPEPEPRRESELFKQDDIIDAFAENVRFTPAAEPEEPQPEEPDEGILDGSSNVYIDVPVKVRPVEPAPREEGESDIISDDIIDGSLIISDEPALDLSETHDNVSDLITGEDTSGMYVDVDAEDEDITPPPKPAKRAKSNAPLENQISIETVLKEKAEESVVTAPVRQYKKYDYAAPPIDLLKIYEQSTTPQEELESNAQILETVVSQFLKAQIKVINIVPGPQVTQYELDVPLGVSVKSIEARAADIAYELASISGVRVQAPIPGKRAVGIEVPNTTKSIVGLREVVQSQTFTKSRSPFVFSVGKDIGGSIVVCDLEKVPHLLIAGQTGSGKSAGLSSLIISLLYKASPEDLRFILIDPKRVEFSKLRGMPHLLFEKTVSEPAHALNALKWAAGEMERRYNVLQKYSCGKLAEYNELPDVKSGKINKLPHIVVVIDELANLMQSSVGGEIENKISSIAALARAAGIHLIVATQRPSQDVITGTIKANLTSRIAFKVQDATNSRIIIDENGAEALAGNGDMLFYPTEYPSPKRVQGSFVTGEEVLSVVNYLKEHYDCDFDEEAERFVCGGGGEGGVTGGDDEANSLDPLAAQVMASAIRSKQISVSVVQRRFSIGYARAARIVDAMEAQGFIGPITGNSKPREVFMDAEQYKEVFGHDLNES